MINTNILRYAYYITDKNFNIFDVSKLQTNKTNTFYGYMFVLDDKLDNIELHDDPTKNIENFKKKDGFIYKVELLNLEKINFLSFNEFTLTNDELEKIIWDLNPLLCSEISNIKNIILQDSHTDISFIKMLAGSYGVKVIMKAFIKNNKYATIKDDRLILFDTRNVDLISKTYFNRLDNSQNKLIWLKE